MRLPILRALVVGLLLLPLAACEDPQDQPTATTGPAATLDDDHDRPATRFASVEDVFEAYPQADAVAIIQPTALGSVEGYAFFEDTGNGIRATVRLEGLDPNARRGFHVHEYGSCAEGDDGTPAGAAGGHFAPMDRPHGGLQDPPEERHVGDFGNLEAGPDGTVDYTFEDTVARIHGERGIAGRALMVHTEADDLESQPTGDAGERAGCGVIEARNGDVQF